VKFKDSIYLRIAFGYVVIIFPFTLIFSYFYFANYNYVKALKSISSMQLHPHISLINNYISNLKEENLLLYSIIRNVPYNFSQNPISPELTARCNCHSHLNAIKNSEFEFISNQFGKEKLCYSNNRAFLCNWISQKRIQSFKKNQPFIFSLINIKIFSGLKESISKKSFVITPTLYPLNELIIGENFLLALTNIRIRLYNINNLLMLYFIHHNDFYENEVVNEIDRLLNYKEDNLFKEASIYFSPFENLFLNDLFLWVQSLKNKLQKSEDLISFINTFNQKLEELDEIKLSREREFTFHFNGIYEQITFYEQIYINFLFISLLSMFFGIILSYIIVKPILSSISHLKSSIEKVKEGNFNITFDKIGKDELSELQLAFVKMSQALKEREEEINQRNKEIAEMQASLIQSSKLSAIGMLSAGIAHELNQPLMVINSYIDIVKEDFKNNNKINEDINILKKQIEKMKNIIFQLSDFSKTESKIAVVDINQIIENVLTFTSNYFSKNNIRIIKNFNLDLPSLLVNQSQIEQVILNILTNAVDAIKPKGKGTIIITTSQISSNEVAIAISDDGIGIPNEFLDKIFEPFFTTKQPGAGIGLGLYVSYKIIAAHNGRIIAKSKENEGSEFIIYLPIKVGD